MKKNSILGVVVVYNPNIEKLIYNINCYIQSIDKLLFWQNSFFSSKDKARIKNECNYSHKIVFCGDEINRGLDVAFNKALEVASKENYSYLMTMDQDSTWAEFANYLLAVMSVKNEQVAIFGPKVINAFDSFDSQQEETPIEITDFVISSGAVYKVSVLNKIGGFADGYFIDAIDEEVCFRAKKQGFEIVKINKVNLLQEFGAYRKRKIFGKIVASSNYSAFRYFFIVRNHIWLAKSGLLDKWHRRITLRNYVFSLPVKVLLFEKDKIRKMMSIMRGVWYGCFSTPKARIKK